MLGASDYVSKPIKPAVLKARVRIQLEARQTRDWLRNEQGLEDEVAHRRLENDQTQFAALRALAHLAETRDDETGQHILRTQNFVWLLAELLRDHPRFSRTLTS